MEPDHLAQSARCSARQCSALAASSDPSRMASAISFEVKKLAGIIEGEDYEGSEKGLAFRQEFWNSD